MLSVHEFPIWLWHTSLVFYLKYKKLSTDKFIGSDMEQQDL